MLIIVVEIMVSFAIIDYRSFTFKSYIKFRINVYNKLIELF